jgi:hypothetical protein
MAAARPALADELVALIRQCDAQIARRVEDARLNRAIDLTTHIRGVAKWVRDKAAHVERLRTLGRDVPPVDILAVIAGAVLDVRRWEGGSELRDMGGRYIGALTARWVEAARGYDNAVAGFGAWKPNPQQAAAGIVAADEIPTVEPLLMQHALVCQDLAARIASLDPRGDGGRAAAVKAAIEKHGGLAALAAALAPGQRGESEDELRAAERALADVGGRLAGIDDERTDAAAKLRAARDAAQGHHHALMERVAAQRVESAKGLLTAALTGPPKALAAVVRAAAPYHAAFSADVDAARGDRGFYLAVVGEVLRGFDDKAKGVFR